MQRLKNTVFGGSSHTSVPVTFSMFPINSLVSYVDVKSPRVGPLPLLIYVSSSVCMTVYVYNVCVCIIMYLKFACNPVGIAGVRSLSIL